MPGTGVVAAALPRRLRRLANSRRSSVYGTARDTYNTRTVSPVTTTGLRVALQLQQAVSAGILEWRVNP